MNPIAKKRWIAVAVCASVFLALGIFFLLWPRFVHTQDCAQYINKDVHCSDSDDTPLVKASDLRQSVEEKIKTLTANNQVDLMSVYYQELGDSDNREWFSINNNQLYYPASISKIPIMMWFMSQSENDPTILDKKIHYVAGTVKSNQHYNYGGITPGSTYTVSELLDSMITKSDNNAAFVLADLIGPEQLAQTFNDLGMRLPQGTTTSYRIDTKTVASFFRILYDASYLTPEDSAKALTMLTQTKFTNGLQAGVPSNIKVAHKFGEGTFNGEHQLHDCGIIYKPDNSYVLCVMTAGTDFDNMASSISSISQTVYENN